MTTADGVYLYKCGLFFTDTGVTAVQLGSSNDDMVDVNSETWAKVVESVNTNKMSIVDYGMKDVPNFGTAQSIKITTYDQIKGVNVTKATDTGNKPEYNQYIISFSTGFLTAVSYRIPAVSVDEAVALLNKTPLASKVKRSN